MRQQLRLQRHCPEDEANRRREIIKWGMCCTCPSIDDCTCGIHNAKPASSRRMVREDTAHVLT